MMSKRTRIIIGLTVAVVLIVINIGFVTYISGLRGLFWGLVGLTGGGVLIALVYLLARIGNREAVVITKPQAYGDLDSAIRRITELETETAQLKNDLRWRGVMAYFGFFCVLAAYMVVMLLPTLFHTYEFSAIKFSIPICSLFILIMFTNVFVGLKMKHPGRKELIKGELRDVLTAILIPFVVVGIAVALTLYFGQS